MHAETVMFDEDSSKKSGLAGGPSILFKTWH